MVKPGDVNLKNFDTRIEMADDLLAGMLLLQQELKPILDLVNKH